MDKDRLRDCIDRALTDAVPWLTERFECVRCGWGTVVVRQVGRPAGRFMCSMCGGRTHEEVDEFNERTETAH